MFSLSDRRDSPTPLAALGAGLLAGAVGTAAMTGTQELWSRVKAQLSDDEDGGPTKRPAWKDAPAPAQVGKRLVEGLFERKVPVSQIGLYTNVMHWVYGISWGAAYGLLQGSLRTEATASQGLAFGAGVWGMSYVELVPMGLYEPPWKYPPLSLAPDFTYHLAYGVGVAGAFEALELLRTRA